MKELKDFLNKDRQKTYLEIFMILDQLSRKEDIISFTYDKDYLIVKTGVNDYYRIKMEEVNKC